MRYLCSALLGLAAASLFAATPALAQYVPTQPIELVVHSGPGGGPDAFGRAFVAAIEQEKLAPVRIQVANKPGGGGATAMAYVVQKKGSPNTVAVWTNLWVTLPMLQQEATASIKEMTPIARVVVEPALVTVRAELPYQDLKSFIEAARQKPGQIKQSGGSPTARDNVVRLLLMNATKAQWSFISFPSGGERIAALLGGHVDLLITEPFEAGEQIRSGKLRAIARLGGGALEGFAKVPTIAEAGFTIPNVPLARGFVGPPDMPADAVAYFQGLFERASKSKAWQDYLRLNLLESGFLDAAATRAFFSTYETSMREILPAAGVKLVR